MHAFTLLLVSVMLALAGPARANAQSAYCLPLQMELAELERSGAGSGSSDGAVRRELSRMRAEERRAGCRSFFQSRSTRNTCRSIRSRISSLERQLSGSRGLFGNRPSALDRRRDQVREALARNGCSTRAYTAYRTICVRLCDGYYFPLSNTSSRQRFSQDAQKCMGQYALGQAELFYHPFPNGDASQAVSLDGKRYPDQPYAFAFRSRFFPQCAAQLEAGLAALRQRVFTAIPTLPAGIAPALLRTEQVEAVAGTQALSVPIPIPLPVGSSDPETVANRAGGLVPEKILVAPEMEFAEVALVGKASRGVGKPYFHVDTQPGPPPTVAGYHKREREDFRLPQRASLGPLLR
jgi:Protein of unknown function (DUF2865)